MHEEEKQKWLDNFITRAGFTYGWENLESWARRMAERAYQEVVIEGGSDEKQNALRNVDFPSGMTVAELKALVRYWPETDEHGEPCEVWVCDAHGNSNQVRMATPLNMRQSEEGCLCWADFMLGYGGIEGGSDEEQN